VLAPEEKNIDRALYILDHRLLSTLCPFEKMLKIRNVFKNIVEKVSTKALEFELPSHSRTNTSTSNSIEALMTYPARITEAR
jgi:hypothetical protein